MSTRSFEQGLLSCLKEICEFGCVMLWLVHQLSCQLNRLSYSSRPANAATRCTSVTQVGQSMWLQDAPELLESPSRCGYKMHPSYSSCPVDAATRSTQFTGVVHPSDPGCLHPIFFAGCLHSALMNDEFSHSKFSYHVHS